MFLNLVMLAGIGGALLPLVLHLLSRARYQTVDWGAMIFLADLDTQRRTSGRLKQFTLLALRMLIVATLAIALARPAISKGRALRIAGQTRITAVIILDCSASMSVEEEGRTRLDAARDVVLQILASLHGGDQVSLILAGQSRREGDAPTSNFQDIAARVADATPTGSTADLGAALVDALNIFDRAESSERQLYIVADRQATTWRRLTIQFTAGWSDRLRRGGSAVRAFVLPVGAADPGNVAIESLRLIDPPAVRECAADVQVTLRNYGSEAQKDLPLTIATGGRIAGQTTSSIGPRTAQSLRVPITFTTSGPQLLTATLKSGDLALDNQLDAIVDVIDPIKTLILSGDERPVAAESESFFLRAALMPFQSSGAKSSDLAAVEVRPVETWNPADIAQFKVIVLANAIELSPPQIAALEQFVSTGGGLLIAPGALTWTGSFNRLMYRNGAGLSPAAIEPPAADAPQITTLAKFELPQPLFRALRFQPPPLRFTRFFAVANRSPASHVLATFATGTPFLLESSFGRGHVILMTAPIDADAGEFPRSELYLPLMQSIVHYLAASESPPRSVEAGEEIVLALDAPTTARRATITLPDGSRDSADIVAGERGEIRFTNTRQSGVYAISFKDPAGEKVFRYTVRPPRDESDLAAMEPAEWRNLLEALNFDEIDTHLPRLATQLSEARTGHEIWLPLLGAVLALGLVELSIARRWSTETA